MVKTRFATFLLLASSALLLAMSGSSADDEPGAEPTAAPMARQDLELPEALWRQLAGPTGLTRPGSLALGFSADQMQHFGGSRFRLRTVDQLFSDVRAVPRYSGKLTDTLLGATKDLGGVVRAGFYALDASAGRGVEAPRAGTWGVDWLEDEVAPGDALVAVLSRLQVAPEDVASLLARDLSEPLMRLLARLLITFVETRPLFAAAYSEGHATGAGTPYKAVTALVRDDATPAAIGSAIRDLEGLDLGFLALASIAHCRWTQGAIEEFLEATEEGNAHLPTTSVAFETALGTVVLGGTSDDVHEGGEMLLIDLGGHDTYAGAHAVPPSLESRVGCLIDLGGDDTYVSEGRGGLCTGTCGLGLLIDCGGDDTYRGGEGSLASAWHGAAVLWDLAGNDTYESTGSYAQGAAHGGVAALIDGGGDDSYLTVSHGQAYGGTLGFGALIDCGGDDTYEGTGTPSEAFHDEITLCQGIGMGRRADFGDGHSLGGGIGVLVDALGNDTYTGKVYAQGAGYWWALGILEDRAGDDTYSCRWYSLGAAPHFAIGCCVDLTGNDAYNVDNETARCQWQGCARDGSVAVFIDGEGDDRYRFGNRCAGSGDLNSTALFWDRAGDDRYHLFTDGSYAKDRSFGGACEYAEPHRNFRDEMPTVGLFLDSGGQDKYVRTVGEKQEDLSAFEPTDDMRWVHQSGPVLHGLGLDLEAELGAGKSMGAPVAEAPAFKATEWPADERAALVLPDAVWDEILPRVGHGPRHGRERLGFTREEMRHFHGSKHVLRRMDMAFRDVPALPRFSGRLSDRFLASAAKPASILALGYVLLDAGAGFGVEVPKKVEVPASFAEVEGWADLPAPVQEFVARVHAAATEAKPWVDAAIDADFLRKHFGVEDLDDVDREALFHLAMHPFYEGYDGIEEPCPDAFRLMDHFDRSSMAMATTVLLKPIDAAVEALRAWAKSEEGERALGALELDTLILPTDLGPIRVAGTANHEHAGGDLLLLDLGGDDDYAGRGNLAAPVSFAQPIGILVDVAGEDRYLGGVPVGVRPVLGMWGVLPQAFGDRLVFAVESDTEATVEGFLNATRHFQFEWRDETLWVWDTRDEEVKKALAAGERPKAEYVREDATRTGGRIGSVSEAAVDRFCWERRQYVCDTTEDEFHRMRLVALAEDTDALGHWEGVDRPGSIASGLFGIGALYDLAGDDVYRARRNGLGEGLYGTGLLLDFEGDDDYHVLRSCGQGVGHVGVGALIDLAGNDRYRTGSVSQGFGGTLGTGILVDVEGNDTYLADLDGRRQGIYRNQSVSFVQGSGCGRRADFGDGHSLGGGFGILVDGAGDDFYESGAYGQGNAYWWSMGILEDRGGNDTHRMMQYGLGTAPHFAIGICVNLAGDDTYNIDYPVMQRYLGHGRDGSIGVFIDGDGDDQYAITCDSAGHADLNTLALFWDRRGDDVYNLIPSSGKLRGHGSVAPYAPHRTFRDAMPSVGVFLDTGGRDTYLDRPSWPGGRAKGLSNPGADDTWWVDAKNAAKARFGFGWDVELYPRADGD